MFFRDEDAIESPEDALCPHDHPHDDPLIPSGREAVTLSKQPMIDAVQVAIRPAARTVDRVTGKVAHEYEFFIVVSDLHTGTERQSQNSFTWSAAKDALDSFRNLSSKRAWEVLAEIDESCRTKR